MKILPSQRLKMARLGLALTMRDFAAPLGVNPATIHKWESNKTAIPVAACQAIEQVYGISSKWLQDGEGTPGDFVASEFVHTAEIVGQTVERPALNPPEPLAPPRMSKRRIKARDIDTIMDGRNTGAAAARILDRLIGARMKASMAKTLVKVRLEMNQDEAIHLQRILIHHLNYSSEPMPIDFDEMNGNETPENNDSVPSVAD